MASTPGDRQTEPLKTKDPASPPSIRGEKRVKGTERTVPVEPPEPEAGGPTEPAAVDHRKQFTGGTDEPVEDR